jgi:hypothetical protein
VDLDAFAQRQAPRFHSHVPVRLHIDALGDPINAMVRDISRMGAGLTVRLPMETDPPVEAPCTIELTEEDKEPVMLPARLRSVVRIAAETGNVVQLGVSWEELPPEGEQALQRFVMTTQTARVKP